MFSDVSETGNTQAETALGKAIDGDCAVSQLELSGIESEKRGASDASVLWPDDAVRGGGTNFVPDLLQKSIYAFGQQ